MNSANSGLSHTFWASALVLTGLALILWALSHQLTPRHPISPPERLARDWQYDLERLEAAGRLPAPWNSVRSIQWLPAGSLAEEWLKVLQDSHSLPRSLPLEDKQACCDLHIMLIAWDDEVQLGAIVQYQLIDHESGNLLWEMGRTFVLEERQELTSDAAHF